MRFKDFKWRASLLNKLKSLVQFYEDNYRHESLERFQFYEAYSFNGNVKINNIYIKNIWPESWEIGNTKGIMPYFIMRSCYILKSISATYWEKIECAFSA